MLMYLHLIRLRFPYLEVFGESPQRKRTIPEDMAMRCFAGVDGTDGARVWVWVRMLSVREELYHRDTSASEINSNSTKFVKNSTRTPLLEWQNSYYLQTYVLLRFFRREATSTDYFVCPSALMKGCSTLVRQSLLGGALVLSWWNWACSVLLKEG